MGHLLYLMFRCDFDVIESLEEFGGSEHSPAVSWLTSTFLPSNNTNKSNNDKLNLITEKYIFTCTHETPSCTVEHCMLQVPKAKASISDNGAHTSKYVRTNLFLSRLRTHFKIQKLMVLPSLDSLVVFCIFPPQNFKLFFQVLDVCCVQKYQSSRSLSSVLNQAFASILIWRHSLFRLTHATCAIHA